MKKLLSFLMLYFTSFLTLAEKEIEIIEKYLNYESFEKLIKETKVLSDENFEKISLKELNEILQKNWFQGAKKERWQFENILFENEKTIAKILQNIYKKDGIIDFEIKKEKIDLNNSEKFENVKNIIIFGSTFKSILNRAICAKSIINENNKYNIIFLTGYRKIDEKVDYTDEKRAEILENLFPEIKNKNLYYKKSQTEEDLVEQIKNIVFFETKNCEVEIFSEKVVEGKRATTESTLKKLFSERNFPKDSFTIGISTGDEFINYQQSVVDLFFKEQKIDFNISVFGFNKSFSDYFIKNNLERARLLSEKLDTISRIVYNCFKISNLGL